MLDDPLSVFVAPGDFGQPVVVHTRPAKTINAIFDEAFMDPTVGELVMDARNPRLTCVEADAAGIERGTRVTVGTKEYEVKTVEPDGTGMCLITLLLA